MLFVAVAPERFFAVSVTTLVPGFSFAMSGTTSDNPCNFTPGGNPLAVTFGWVMLSTSTVRSSYRASVSMRHSSSTRMPIAASSSFVTNFA